MIIVRPLRRSDVQYYYMPEKNRTSVALGGLLECRESWRLSFSGKLTAFLAIGGMAFACLLHLYSFLAITSRVTSDLMVVDGWMPTYVLEQAASAYREGHYQRLLVVRGVYPFDSAELDRTWDDYVAGILVKHGVSRQQITSVLFVGTKRDRTFNSAIAIREWFRQRRQPLHALEVVTLGPHARRSRLIYQRALGGDVEVGVIGLEDPAYDASRWWRSSEGIREVIFEGVAYLYVRFTPSPPPPAKLELL